jgi:acetylglutamate kinase
MSDATPAGDHTIVVKIGGSTLGDEDTTLADVVELRRDGMHPIVVHGGGAMITDWLHRLGVHAVFIEGLRSTNAEALEVVIGVLRGIVNTRLVAEIDRLGGRAIGLSGVDAKLVQARRVDERLGFVGEVTRVDREALRPILESGAIPVIAPIGLEPPGQPLNINADTVAGEIARALGAHMLVFLTDVDGVLDGAGALVEVLDAERAAELREAGTLAGGMIPKIDASLRAAERGAAAYVAYGRVPRTLARIVAGEQLGTRIEV